MRVWFHGISNTLISGSIPTMTSLQLLIDSDFMTDIDFRDEMMKYQTQTLDFRYPFTVRQTFTQNMAPNGTFDFVLSGLNGLFTELRFTVNPANLVGNNVKTYYRIQDFEIMNQNGTNIIGGSVKTHNESQYIDYPKHYLNDQNLHLNIYRYSFSQDPVSMIERGQVAGFLNFNGRDQLRIKTGNAEVKKVITITRYVGPGPVASGHFRLVYKGHYTDIILYNATANQIALALELMPPFLDTLTDVSVSAVISAQ